MPSYPSLTELDEAFLELLAPVTRWRFPPPEEGDPVLLNEHGFDHWVNHVGSVKTDSRGRAHQYVATYGDAGRAVRGRTDPRASQFRWGVNVNIGGADSRRVRWALDRLRGALDGARLDLGEGRVTAPLREVYGEGFPIRRDDDVSPPRWYTTVRYATSAH